MADPYLHSWIEIILQEMRAREEVLKKFWVPLHILSIISKTKEIIHYLHEANSTFV